MGRRENEWDGETQKGKDEEEGEQGQLKSGIRSEKTNSDSNLLGVGSVQVNVVGSDTSS